MHPVPNVLSSDLDASAMLLSLSGICIPLSFLAGTALVLSKAAGSSLPPPALEYPQDRSVSRKRKALELDLEEELESRSQSNPESKSDSSYGYEYEYGGEQVRLRKKARMGEPTRPSQFPTLPASTSMDEVERSLYDGDATLVSKEFNLTVNGDDNGDDVDNLKASRILSFDYSDGTDQSHLGGSKSTIRPTLEKNSEKTGGANDEASTSLTIKATNPLSDAHVNSNITDINNPNPHSRIDTDIEDLDTYDPTNARHEWELQWFVCAHHAAFTAATGMSLRSEIRRRKALVRLYRHLKDENAALKEVIRRFESELYGDAAVEEQDGERVD